MRYLHTLDPDDFREMEEQRKRDDEDVESATKSFIQWIKSDYYARRT